MRHVSRVYVWCAGSRCTASSTSWACRPPPATPHPDNNSVLTITAQARDKSHSTTRSLSPVLTQQLQPLIPPNKPHSLHCTEYLRRHSSSCQRHECLARYNVTVTDAPLLLATSRLCSVVCTGAHASRNVPQYRTEERKYPALS